MRLVLRGSRIYSPVKNIEGGGFREDMKHVKNKIQFCKNLWGSLNAKATYRFSKWSNQNLDTVFQVYSWILDKEQSNVRVCFEVWDLDEWSSLYVMQTNRCLRTNLNSRYIYERKTVRKPPGVEIETKCYPWDFLPILNVIIIQFSLGITGKLGAD